MLSASRRSTTSGMTTVWPETRAVIDGHRPAPCMNGGSVMTRDLAPLIATCTMLSASAHSSPVRRSVPPRAATNTSAWRHMTPLGMPVVPPV